MLLHVFLLLLTIHYVYLVIGIERKKGGYVLMAIMMLIVLMWSAAYVIQVPIEAATPVNTTEGNTTTLDFQGTVIVRAFRDPITSFFLFAQELIDVWIYGWIIRWGRRGDRGWF